MNTGDSRLFWQCKIKSINLKLRVSNCFAMESTEDILSIQDFPDEMLQQILSLLSLKNQKSASLVCRRWSRLAIRPADVVLVVDSNRETVENYLQHLMTSNRRYKHVRIAAFRNPTQDVAAEVLINKFRHTLLSLELGKLSNFQQVWELCTNVQCLNIVKCFSDPRVSEELVLTPLPRLRHLKTSAMFFHLHGINVGQIAPNLTELSVDYPKGSTSYSIPTSVLDYLAPRLTNLQTREIDDSVLQCQFPQLLQFRCEVDSRRSGIEKDISKFLTRCKNLRVISLGKHNFFSDGFLRNLADSCRHLRELSLELMSLDQDNFLQLCRMKQLQRLHISHVLVDLLKPDFPASDLRELVLEKADVQHMRSFNASIEAAFPKLVLLHIKYSTEEPLRLSNFKHLESVYLEDSNLDFGDDLLDEFAPLRQLRSISVRSLKFNIGKLQAKYDLAHIKRLSIWTRLDDRQLRQLTRLFPALTRLQLCGRLKCTPEGLRMAKQLLPAGCEVQLLADGELLPRRGLKIEREWCCELMSRN